MEGMIKINFSPCRRYQKTSASLSGSVLTVDGEEFDLSLIEDGATIQHDVIKNCTRTGEDYELTITLGHGYAAPEQTRFPVAQDVADGWFLDYVFDIAPEVLT
jgi:hypothetical protein